MTSGSWSQSTEGLAAETSGSFAFILGALSSRFVDPPFSGHVGVSHTRLRCAGRCVTVRCCSHKLDLLKETLWRSGHCGQLAGPQHGVCFLPCWNTFFTEKGLSYLLLTGIIISVS